MSFSKLVLCTLNFCAGASDFAGAATAVALASPPSFLASAAPSAAAAGDAFASSLLLSWALLVAAVAFSAATAAAAAGSAAGFPPARQQRFLWSLRQRLLQRLAFPQREFEPLQLPFYQFSFFLLFEVALSFRFFTLFLVQMHARTHIHGYGAHTH